MKLLGGWLVTAAMVAGCGTPVAAGTQPNPSVQASPTYTSVSAAIACPPVVPVHWAADDGASSGAYVCRTEVRDVPGDGSWQFQVVTGVTGGLDTLLHVYATPDAALGSGACTMELPDPLVVWLRGAETVAVRAPRDDCGKPTGEARAAYQGLTTVVLSTTRLTQVTSQLATDSGCSDSYKDMLSIEESSGGPPQTAAQPQPVTSGTRVCFYRVAPDEQGDRVGHLTSTELLTQEQTDAINAALRVAVVDRTCGRHTHTHFALLSTAGGGTLVALDGCAVQQDQGWWRAGDPLRTALS